MKTHRKKRITTLLLRLATLVVALIGISFVLSNASASSAAAASGPQTAAAHTFYTQFIVAGGPIVWFILLPLSVVTLYLAIDLTASIRRKKLTPAGIASRIGDIYARSGLEHLIIAIADNKDLVSKAILTAITKSRNLRADQKYINSLAAESLQESTMKLFRAVEWSAIIGNVAPMIGLFGTVFGMIKAFNILGQAGSQPPADQLAAAISIALVTTFWGLLIAIPALAMHGIFRTRIETIVSEAALETEILLQRITSTPPTPPAVSEASNQLKQLQEKINSNTPQKTNTIVPQKINTIVPQKVNTNIQQKINTNIIKHALNPTQPAPAVKPAATQRPVATPTIQKPAALITKPAPKAKPTAIQIKTPKPIVPIATKPKAPKPIVPIATQTKAPKPIVPIATQTKAAKPIVPVVTQTKNAKPVGAKTTAVQTGGAKTAASVPGK